jgi:hypothetical protein
MFKKEDLEQPATEPSQAIGVYHDPSVNHDAVFGEITEEGPNYRDVCIP